MPKRPPGARAPATFDACMDAGIDQEERGERFAVDAKAQRHYEAAYAHYAQAAALDPTSVDAHYNAARVQHTLGTAFYAPPDAHDALARALEHAAAALPHAAPDVDGVPDAARLDVLANAAYALEALAELLDTFPSDDARWHARIAAAVPALAGRAADPAALYRAALDAFADVEAGQRAVLAHALHADAPTRAAAAGAPQYTSSVVAPSSVLETCNDELTCATALLAHTESDTLPATLEHAHAIAARADAWCASLPAGLGARQSPEHEWDAQTDALRWNVLAADVAAVQRAHELAALASAAWPSDGADVARVDALAAQVEQHAAALLAAPPPAQSLTSVRGTGDAQRAHETAVERLCDVADHAQALGAVYATAPATAAHAWALYGMAARCLTTALAALEPGAPSTAPSAAAWAVPGAPMAWIAHADARPVRTANTSTPLSRTRASVYLTLAQLAMQRADAPLVAAHAPAAEAQGKLLAHARIYARRALLDHGLGWVMRVSPAAPAEEAAAAPMVYGRALAHGPPPGWEALAQDAELLLTAARALWLRSTYEAAQGLDASATHAELVALAGVVWTLRHGVPARYAEVLDATPSVRRMLDARPGASPVAPAEQDFWQQWIGMQDAVQGPPAIPGRDGAPRAAQGRGQVA
ncbi:hypothetical protein MBRA1_003417 [Malassezia brasiliensis]|uniref:Uncharacterized protein n=1 Tax=Malassezia brasiliensis TaxID=1821822 RepID=A0AAF0DUU4_9BASI|nr:hypothetical protein MBRA1_003417 [Malassezia brasiliensis]